MNNRFFISLKEFGKKDIMCRIFLIFVLFLNCNYFLYSQQNYFIKGIVVDKNQTPLEAVSVKLIEGATSKLINYAITDSKGKFSIEAINTGNYNLEVLSLGYENYVTTLNITKNILLDTIVLSEKSIDLEQVVIRSRKKMIKPTEEGIQLSVQGTPLSKERDLLSVLKYAPNMNGLEIAGSPHIKILLNGKEVKIKPEQFEVFLKTIKPKSVKKIEITDRTDASFEGNITGQLNIITKEEDGFSGSLSTAVLHNNFFGTINNASFYYGKKNLRLFLELYQSDKLVETKERETQIINQNLFYNNTNKSNLKRQERDVIFGFDYTIDTLSSIGFMYNYTEDNDKDYTIFSNQEISGSTVLSDSLIQINKNFEHLTDTHTFSVQYNKVLDTLGSNISLSSDLALYKFKEPMQINNRFYSSSIIIDSTETNQNYIANSSIFGTKLDWRKNFSNGKSFSTGLKFSLNTNNDEFTFYDRVNSYFVLNTQYSNVLKFNEYIYAAYFNYRFKIKKNTLLIGSRIEYNVNFFGNNDANIKRDNLRILPTLYYNIPFNEKNRIYFYATKKITRPSYFRYNPVVIQYTPVSAGSGNPDLIPVDNYTFQFGYTYKRKYSLIGNYTYQENTVITYTSFNQENGYVLTQPVNSGYQNTAFLLFSIPVNLYKWWEITNKISVRNTSFYSPLILPKQLFKATFATFDSYHMLFSSNKVNLNINISYRTPYRSLYYKYSDFFTTDLGVSTSFKEKFNLSLYITDVFYSQRNILQYRFNEVQNRRYSRINSRGIFFGISYDFSIGKEVSDDVLDSNIEEEKKRISH